MSEEEDIPSAAECQSLVERFAEITSTNEALAQSFLQENEWNLERSVEQFLVASGTYDENPVPSKRPQKIPSLEEAPPLKSPKIEIPSHPRKSLVSSVGPTKNSAELTTTPPSEFRFLTWNLDGIEPKNLKLRTKAAAKIIEMEGYDIVFLQEVTEDTHAYLEKLLPQYLFVSGRTQSEPYYCVTLMKIFFVYHDSHSIIPFPSSVMGRNILRVDGHIGKFKLVLLNSHLESTADFANERVLQLKQVLRTMSEVTDANVIFAGDMNLRDKELANAGGLPAGISDAWIICGSKKEYQYSWDLTRNTNKQMPSKFQPRLRFDRVFVKPLASSDARIRVVDFKLTGIQKVSGTTSFPSDHWGVAVNIGLPSA